MGTNKKIHKEKTNMNARQRQMRSVITLAALGVVLVIALIIIGVQLYIKWDNRFVTDTSTLFLLKDGKVATTDVVAFNTDKYSQSELESFVTSSIEAYNKAHGEGAVTQKSLTIEENVASLILVYKDAKTYGDFVDGELFMGSIRETFTAGFDFDAKFVEVADGKKISVSKDAFWSNEELKVAVVKTNTKISVEGEILYVSAENVDSVGENWIITKNDANLLGTEDGETETGTTETETETESFADGEFSTEEETGSDIIFDFGDEEEAGKEENSYSATYTYIIYK